VTSDHRQRIARSADSECGAAAGRPAFVFFDIDGTLMDNDYAGRAAALAFLREHRGRIDLEDEAFVGLCMSICDRHLVRYFDGATTYDEFGRAWMVELFATAGAPIWDREAGGEFRRFLVHYEKHWHLYPDALPCLEALAGLRMGIISNGDSAVQRAKMERTGIMGRFDPVVVSGDVGVAKPAAGIFLEACCRVGEPPERCCYVGDLLETDALGSSGAGLRGVWLDRQGLSRGDEAVAVIRGLGELPELLRGFG